MEGSMRMGFMAVFAVSGSVVLVANQVHKHLLSDFMNKIESELCRSEIRCSEVKKRVRFAEDVMEPSSDNKEYRKKKQSTKAVRGHNHDEKKLMKMDVGENMPLNRQMLYRGIIEYKSIKSLNCF
ncbi:hypothetical protein Q3G72_032460 [Acer saccharum]|nr:hypothetical protein Q3G72_032460 [Acer saccharum]